MDESEREPPEEEKPLTREDVLRLIEEHGGPEGLDLEKADLENVDLSGLDLHGSDLSHANLQSANLREASLQGASLCRSNLRGACLQAANLEAARFWLANLYGADVLPTQIQRADLSGANLQNANLQGVKLYRANLQQANLDRANLHAADLRGANLQQAHLYAANLQGADLRWRNLRRAGLAYATRRDTNLEGANWGDYILAEEVEGVFDWAASAYRALKQWHTEAGMYDIAGEFHYREMEARRKLAWEHVYLFLFGVDWKVSRLPFGVDWKVSRLLYGLGWKVRRLPYALTMYFLRFLYGYGERPQRVVASAAVVILGLALVHWAFGTVAGGFLDALYYSAVSFPALGYGEWAPEPQGWAGRFLGAGESFMGVFMMALFLVTFTRKMTR